LTWLRPPGGVDLPKKVTEHALGYAAPSSHFFALWLINHALFCWSHRADTMYNLMPEVDFWDFSSHVENPMRRATLFTMSGVA